MGGNNGKILFIKKSDSAFINKDEAFLRKHFQVQVLDQKNAAGLRFVWILLKTAFQLIWLLPRAKALFIWFGDYHSFLPVLLGRLFRTRTLLVLGGHEANVVPEIGYGTFQGNKIRAIATAWSIRYAHYVLPVDGSMIKGIQERVGKVRGKIEVIPTGYDASKWFCDTPKKQQVLTIASFNSLQRIRLKGLDFFAEVAKRLPQYQFIIAGAGPDGAALLGPLPGNVLVLGPQDQNGLRELYSQSKVYAQFSLSEGLPNVICEAMLCECIPVGVRRGGIPTAIGEHGIIIDQHEVERAVKAVKQAMQQTNGKACREYIAATFPNSRREGKLLEIIQPAE